MKKPIQFAVYAAAITCLTPSLAKAELQSAESPSTDQSAAARTGEMNQVGQQAAESLKNSQKSAESMVQSKTQNPAKTIEQTTDQGTMASHPTDAQIAKILMTTSNLEIDEAKYASRHASNSLVKNFADKMVEEHKSVNKETRQVAKLAHLKPENSEVSKNLEIESKNTMTDLKTKKGADLDRAYISAQIKTHQEVLDTIDKTLMPSARDPHLRATLEKFRPSIIEHLDHAKRIQSSLETSTG
jgi:putative membrane protein